MFAGLMGSLITNFLHVSKTDYDNLVWLILICGLSSGLPIFLVPWLLNTPLGKDATASPPPIASDPDPLPSSEVPVSSSAPISPDVFSPPNPALPHWKRVWEAMKAEPAFYSCVIMAGIVSGGEALAGLAMSYMMKDDMNLEPATMQSLQSIMVIPW